MVDFHTFLQDVLETGGIDMGMYLFEFSLRVLKMSVVTCSNVQGCGSEKAKQAFFLGKLGFLLSCTFKTLTIGKFQNTDASLNPLYPKIKI